MAQTQETLKHYCRQEADTASLAKRLASCLEQFIEAHPKSHLNISLEGDLGAGKTTFARHLIQALGYSGKVKSPTYTLCEPYALKANTLEFAIYHFDLYRMRDPLEWQEAGFAEYFDTPGFCLIEWPEKAEGTLPPFDIQIQLTADGADDERTISITALLNDGLSVLKNLSQ